MQYEASRPVELEAFLPRGVGDPDVRDDNLPHWRPVLPPEVPQCDICALPSSKSRCRGCGELIKAQGTPVATLEFMTVVDKRSAPESIMWGWKNEAEVRADTVHGPHEWLSGVAVGLSGYVEAHASRLLEGNPYLTAVPSRAPLIATAMRMARDKNWYAVPVQDAGSKVGDWYQHSSDKPTRMSRTSEDWTVDADAVAGRPVLLFDDVFVTGTSVFSFARTLKRAGATEIRVVVIGRHVADKHRDYYDALRFVRRTREWRWTPDRAAVKHPRAPGRR